MLAVHPVLGPPAACTQTAWLPALCDGWFAPSRLIVAALRNQLGIANTLSALAWRALLHPWFHLKQGCQKVEAAAIVFGVMPGKLHACAAACQAAAAPNFAAGLPPKFPAPPCIALVRASRLCISVVGLFLPVLQHAAFAC